jgi:NADH:ubiquinone oxidoreductase subunit E
VPYNTPTQTIHNKQTNNRLLQALDARWAEHAEAYSPSAAEAAIAEGLGVPRATVMMFALQTPALQAYDVEEQVVGAVYYNRVLCCVMGVWWWCVGKVGVAGGDV